MVMTDGVHGTVLGPVEMLVLNVILISFSFFLLCRPTQSAKREILVLTSITAAAAASRIFAGAFPQRSAVNSDVFNHGGLTGCTSRVAAFAVMATMLSNLVLSHGLWTFFQATGWAAVAFAGSRLNLVFESEVAMKRLVYSAVIASVLFDWWVFISSFNYRNNHRFRNLFTERITIRCYPCYC